MCWLKKKCSCSFARLMHIWSKPFCLKFSKPKMSRMPIEVLPYPESPSFGRSVKLILNTSHWKSLSYRAFAVAFRAAVHFSTLFFFVMDSPRMLRIDVIKAALSRRSSTIRMREMASAHSSFCTTAASPSSPSTKSRLPRCSTPASTENISSCSLSVKPHAASATTSSPHISCSSASSPFSSGMYRNSAISRRPYMLRASWDRPVNSIAKMW
mmetsp:Transcript_35727/g.93388  ORF Transcript_35727/g.93388 Transcript_35727/m.93388 type:complete len:212 (+) Transcript_35727:3054-3689(+)